MSTSAGPSPRVRVAMFVAEVVLPLALFHALRAAGVGQWLSLLLSGAAPLLLLAHRLLTQRRADLLMVFTLSILLCGTVIGLLTGDPRLLLARESYLTGLVGLWILATVWTSRPLIYRATLTLMPEDDAASWRHSWQHDAAFRRVIRLMTLAWGVAFLIDAAARVVMAYTLPVDVVPGLSAGLLVVMLVIVVQVSKAYGRRILTRRAAA